MGYLEVEKEALHPAPAELVYLPILSSELLEPRIYPAGIHLFNDDAFRANFLLVSQCSVFAEGLGPDMKELQRIRMHPVFDISVQQAIDVVHRLQEAQPVSVSLSELIKDISIPYPAGGLNDVKSLILSRINNSSSENFCFLSGSHTTDASILEAISETGIPLSEIAFVTLDQHLDMVAESNKPNSIRKENFLISLLNKGLGALIVLGLSEEHAEEVVTGKRLGVTTNQMMIELRKSDILDVPEEDIREMGKVVNIHDRYTEYQDRVFIPRSYFSNERQLKRNKMNNLMPEVIEKLRARGIRYIFFSVDADSLNLMKMGISPTEYSPYANIVALGLQNLTPIIEKAGLTLDTIKAKLQRFKHLGQIIDQEKKQFKRNNPGPKATRVHYGRFLEYTPLMKEMIGIVSDIEEAIIHLNYPLPSLPKAFLGIAAAGSEPGGFYFNDVAAIIRGFKTFGEAHGIVFGIPVGKKRVVGSISEIDPEGPDLNGNAAKVMIDIANILNE